MTVTQRGPKIPIGKILLDENKITPDQLKQALAMQKTTTEKLGRLLVDLGFVQERDVLGAYARQLNCQVYDPAKMSIDPQVAKSFPDNLVTRYNIAPLRRDGNKLMVAMNDPTNVFALDDLRMVTGYDIIPVLASLDDISAIHRGGKGGVESVATAPAGAPAPAAAPTSNSSAPSMDSIPDLDSMLDGMRKPAHEEIQNRTDDSGMDLADQAPVIKLVNVILGEAIKQGASDIHIEPDRKNVRVRYRVDGVLYEAMTLQKYVHPPLISRLKIMSDMNIAERRVPQDGRIHIKHDGREFDMRVNTLPLVNGEKCVMRLLDQSSVLIGLGKLGFMPGMMADLEELIVQPNGMLLVTGPTGSGKTTTLYSILNQINSIEKNIITVEDPVEYQLPGINQVSVNRKSGLTFPIAMRAFLRQDPDIIMVGEIRDLETAEIAVQASLTGHLVLSTLHTNNAPATITRLSDMGVEPFLIAASTIGIIAQRLGRKLCSECKAPIEPPLEALLRLGLKEDEIESATFFKPVGCDRCNNRGYKGRVGLYELLIMTEELQDLIVRRAPLSEVTQAAIANGMTTLVKDGLQKVKAGVTTIDEVLRVVSSH
jgi:type IV pilus assembly protein PilB